MSDDVSVMVLDTDEGGRVMSPAHPALVARRMLLDALLRGLGSLPPAWRTEGSARPAWDDSGREWVGPVFDPLARKQYWFHPDDCPAEALLAEARASGVVLVRSRSVTWEGRTNLCYVTKEIAKQQVEGAYEPVGIVTIEGEDWFGPIAAPESVRAYYSKSDLEEC